MTNTDVQVANPQANTSTSVGGVVTTYTISQIITYFGTDLPASSNYPRHARAYILYCFPGAFWY